MVINVTAAYLGPVGGAIVTKMTAGWKNDEMIAMGFPDAANHW